jgi:hypothetical protein
MDIAFIAGGDPSKEGSDCFCFTVSAGDGSVEKLLLGVAVSA